MEKGTIAKVDRQQRSAAHFAVRLREALSAKGLNAAEVSRRSGTPPQLISEYLAARKTAGAENLFALADALSVQPRWLLLGEGIMAEPDEEEAGIVTLPLRDLRGFGVTEDPPGVPVARRLLAPLKTFEGLWLAEMQSDALPSVAAEGQYLVCRAPDEPVRDRKVYIFELDGHTIVRRVSVRPDGLLLRGDVEDATVLIPSTETASLVAVGRVLGAIGFKPA